MSCRQRIQQGFEMAVASAARQLNPGVVLSARLRTALLCTLLVATPLLLAARPAAAEDALELDPIKRAQNELDKAHTDWVDLLAPKGFAAAKSMFDAALKYNARGDVARTRTELENTHAGLVTAGQTAERFKAAFPALVNAVKAAIDPRSSAPTLARQTWDKAALKLNDCATRFERGDVDGARTRAIDAENLMLAAGLEAVTTATLGNARTLIAQAEAAKVASYAPGTLARAKQLVVQASQAIILDRSKLDVPAALAVQAEYEARHATAMAATIRPLLESKDNEFAVEKLILDWEAPLQRLGEALGLSTGFGVAVPFDGGYLRAVENLVKAAQAQGPALAAARDQTAALTEKLRVAEQHAKSLADALEAEKQKLAAAPAVAEAAPAAVFADDGLNDLRSLFAPEDALVTRRANDAVIALIGLRFGSRSAVIDATAAPLLEVLRNALLLRGGSSVMVEVNADSRDDDEDNRTLAQDRANTLREYLLRISQLPPEKLSAFGDSGRERVQLIIRGGAIAK